MKTIDVPISRSHEYDVVVGGNGTNGTIVLHRPYHVTTKSLNPVSSGLVVGNQSIALVYQSPIIPAGSGLAITAQSAYMRIGDEPILLEPAATGMQIGVASASIQMEKKLFPYSAGLNINTSDSLIRHTYAISADSSELRTGADRAAAAVTRSINPTSSGVGILTNDAEIETGSTITIIGSGNSSNCYVSIDGVYYASGVQEVPVVAGQTITFKCRNASKVVGVVTIDGVQQSLTTNGAIAWSVPSGASRIIVGLSYPSSSSSISPTISVSTSSDYYICAIKGNGNTNMAHVQINAVGTTYTYPTTISYLGLPTGILSVVQGKSSSPYGTVYADGVLCLTVSTNTTGSYIYQVPDGARGSEITLALNSNFSGNISFITI